MVSGKIDSLIAQISRMDRAGLVETLRGLKCSFEIDFTDAYLNTIPLERLQHLVLAAGLHRQRSGR